MAMIRRSSRTDDPDETSPSTGSTADRGGGAGRHPALPIIAGGAIVALLFRRYRRGTGDERDAADPKDGEPAGADRSTSRRPSRAGLVLLGAVIAAVSFYRRVGDGQ